VDPSLDAKTATAPDPDPEAAPGTATEPGPVSASGPASAPGPAATLDAAAAAGQDAAPGRRNGRAAAIAKIVIFDIAAPLVAYSLLRSAGLSTVTALVLSGVFPAVGVVIGVIQHRRIDVVGVLVLTGIIIGTILGLISHNARLVLIEGSVPTAVFGVSCLGSLWTQRPLMFRIPLEFIGPDTAKGREMTALWCHEGYRRIMRTITTVWGVGFLVEAALRVVIVYNTSTSTALAMSKVTPFIWAGVLSAWTVGYGTYHKRRGERMAAGSQLPGRSQLPG
jgi:intracellular septation protein A